MQALKSIDADEGYAYAEVTPITREDSENSSDGHCLHLFQRGRRSGLRGERSGNTVTRDKVIRRGIKVVEGDYFNAKNIRRSYQNVQRLGFFEDVQIETDKGSAEDLMVLDVNVCKERSTS